MSPAIWAYLALTSTVGAGPDIFEALAPRADGLTIQKVMEEAIRVAPAVKKSNADLADARSTADSALLGFVPRIDLHAGYTRLSEVDLPPFEILGQEFDSPFPQILDNFLINARVSVPASDYFLSIVHGYRAAKLTEQASRHSVDTQREQAALAAVETFLATVRARAQLVVAEASVAVLEAHLADVQRLADAGLATPGDVLAVRARLASSRVQAQQAGGALTVGRVTLGRQIGAIPGPGFDHADPLFSDAPVAAPPTQEQAVEQAKQHRTEVRALRGFLEAQDNWIAYEAGNKLPHLRVDAGLDYANPNQRVFPATKQFNTTWSVGVSLNWSPNDLVSASSATRKSEQQRVRLEADLAAIYGLINIEVSQALTGMKSSSASIQAATEGVEAAAGTLEDRRRLYEAGEATSRELLDAESDLRRAQLQLVGAHLDHRLAQVRLWRATGRLLERPGSEKGGAR